jgi:hypothetical protein
MTNSYNRSRLSAIYGENVLVPTRLEAIWRAAVSRLLYDEETAESLEKIRPPT